MKFPIRRNKLVVSKTLTKMMLYNFIVILISISCISILFYYIFSKATIEDIQNNIQVNLNDDMSRLELIKSQVFALGLQLINDSDISDGMYGNGPDELIKYRLTNKLIQMKDSNTMLNSVYIYNGRIDQFISSNGSSGSDVLDKLMSTVIKTNDGKDQMKFIPLTYTYKTLRGETDSGNIITFVFSRSPQSGTMASGGTNNLPDGAVIININAEFLQKSFTAYNQSKNNSFFLINSSGDVICDSNLEQFGANVAGSKPFQDILSSVNNVGYLIEKEAGNNYLFTYVKSSSLPFVFINKSDYGMLLEGVRTLRNTIAGLCVLIFVICLVISVLAAYNVYLPFDKLVKKIQWQLTPESENDGKKRNYNDAEYLSNAFASIIRKSDELETSIHENIPLLRKSFLKGLLEGDLETLNECDRKIKGLGLHISGQSCVVLFGIDGYFKQGAESRQYQPQIKVGLEKLIFTCFSTGFQVETADLEEDSIAAIVNVPNEEQFNEFIIGALEDIQQGIWDQLGISVTAAVGTMVSQAENIHQSYTNCLELLKYRFVYGYRSILDNAVIRANVGRKFTSVEKNKKQIIQAIKACDAPLLEKEMEELAVLITGNQYDYIRLAINQLALDILLAEEPLIHSEEYEINFSNIYSSLNSVDTLEESKNWLVLYCKGIIRKLEGKKDNRKKDMIDMVLSYMNQNYHKPELSAEMLSEIANLTPGYFGKIFSEYIGMSVNEYIIDLRMKKAKELLENKNASVNDIAIMVGFTNQSYFTAIFKKNYGITPNQYRIDYRKSTSGRG